MPDLSQHRARNSSCNSSCNSSEKQQKTPRRNTYAPSRQTTAMTSIPRKSPSVLGAPSVLRAPSVPHSTAHPVLESTAQ
eukprot:3678992-Rhodomonas_salina.2